MNEVSVPDKTFTITIEGSNPLTIDEIWPDGGAPENPTREDVAKVLEKYTRRELITDWGLDVDVEVDGLRVDI